MDFFSINPLGSLPFAPPPPVDTPADRAARENEILLHQEMLTQQGNARSKAAADNEALLQKEQQDAAVKARGPGSFGEQATELGRAAGEGIAGLPDLPERIAAGIKNLPQRLSDANVFGTRITPDPHALTVPDTPVSDAYNAALPPDPRYPGTRTVGNIAGPAVVAAPFDAISAASAAANAGRAALPAIVRAAVVRPAVTTGVSLGGAAAGGAAAEGLGDLTHRIMIGGDLNPEAKSLLTDYGSLFGSVAGGEAPAAGRAAAYPLLRHAYTDAGSADRLAAADIAGVTPSLGLVGNKGAAVREDSTTGIPLAGNRAYNTRRLQYEQMDQGVRDAADAARTQAAGGVPPAPGIVRDINEGTLGQGAIDVANRARRSITANVDRVFGRGLSDVVGRDTVLDPITQNQTYDAIARDPTTERSSQVPAIRGIQQRLRMNSAGNIVDPTIEQALQARRTALEALLSRDPTNARLVAAHENVLQQIGNNRGPTWQQQLTLRGMRNDADTGRPYDARMQEAAREAQTDTLREGAIAAGVSGPEFDRINRTTGNLIAQRKALQPITGKPGGPAPAQGPAYTAMFGAGGRRNLNQLNVLNRHAPNELTNLMADQLENKMRGAAAGEPTASPETLDPGAAAKWWDSQPEPAKQAMARTPADRARLDALADIMRADTRRPTRTLPGKGGNTIGAPATLFQNPAIIAGVTGMMTGSPTAGGVLGGLGLAKNLAPSLTARLVANRFTDPQFTRNVVHPPRLRDTQDISRILSTAASSPTAQGRR